MKAFTTFGRFWGPNQFFFYISETLYSKQFSLNKLFLLSNLNPKISRNMCKLRHKVRTAKIYSMKVQILETIFFSVIYRTTQAIFPQVSDKSNKTFYSFFFLFFTPNSMMSKNMRIWHHKLFNAKTGVGPTFYVQMKLDIGMTN